jgi:hypothetical protein
MRKYHEVKMSLEAAAEKTNTPFDQEKFDKWKGALATTTTTTTT